MGSFDVEFRWLLERDLFQERMRIGEDEGVTIFEIDEGESGAGKESDLRFSRCIVNVNRYLFRIVRLSYRI